jgi:hypothetical protein
MYNVIKPEDLDIRLEQKLIDRVNFLIIENYNQTHQAACFRVELIQDSLISKQLYEKIKSIYSDNGWQVTIDTYNRHGDDISYIKFKAKE